MKNQTHVVEKGKKSAKKPGSVSVAHVRAMLEDMFDLVGKMQGVQQPGDHYYIDTCSVYKMLFKKLRLFP